MAATTGDRVAAAESRLSAYRIPGVLLLVGLCAALIVVGWVLMLVSLLYVVAGFSTAAFFLTTAGLAMGHMVLAAACWQYAVALGRKERRALAEAARAVFAVF